MIKEHAINERIARFKSDLEGQTVLTPTQKTNLVEGFVSDIEDILRHLIHTISVVRNGFGDGFIVISYLIKEELITKIVLLEEGRVNEYQNNSV